METIKLIPAEEARAISDPDGLAFHIYKINRQIRCAASHYERRVAFSLWECDELTMVKISARLQAAGYSVKYHRQGVDNVWVEIGW